MAKYDPMLQQSSGNPYIAPGIATPSWANVLPELADIGMKTYGAMKTTDLWEQMQGDITGYLQDKSMADSQATAAQQEYNAGVAHENKLWDAAGTIPEHIGIGQQGQEFDGAHPAAFVDAGEIDAVQRNLTQTFDRFVRAKEAGKMSVNELYTRIQTTVKTAAANNPLIQDQLIQQAQKYMEVSGASSWMKAKLSMEEKAAKDEDALFKQDEDWAKKYGVSMTRPNWREEAREQAVLSQNHTLNNNRMEEMMKRRTISKQQLSEIVNDPMQRQKWMKGALGTVHETFMHGSSQGMNPNEVFQMTNSAIDSQITFVNSLMAYLPPDERVSLQGEAKLLEEQRSIYKELAEGGPSAAAAQNKLAYAQALAKMPNVSANEAADMLLKIANIHRTIMGETGELPWGTEVSSQLGNKDQILKYMQQMQNNVDTYAPPVVSSSMLVSPSGKEAVKIASNLISPMSNPEALRINSQSIDKFLDHIATIKDPDAATQAADVYVKQMVDSAKAANMPIGKMLDAASLAKLNTHLGSLMGSFRSGKGQVDYDPQLNTFSYLNEDGSVNKVASDRANMIFKAVISANGFTEEDTIDKWGSSVSSNAMKSMVDPRLARLQTMADGYNVALQEGDTELANAFKVSMARLEKEMGGYVPTEATPSGAYPSEVTTFPDPSIPVVTSKALLEPEVPPGMNKGASGPVTVSPVPLPAGVPVEPVKAPQKAVKESPGAQFADRPKPIVKRGKVPEPKTEVTREQIKQAEREIIGESITKAPLKHMSNQEAIMQRAETLAKHAKNKTTPGLFVSEDKDRIISNPKAKWYVSQEFPNGKVRMYSPEEKVYVDVAKKDIPQLEAWFKTPKASWKRWEK